MHNSKAKAVHTKKFLVFPLIFLNFHTKLTQKLQDKTSGFNVITPVFILEYIKKKKKPKS